MVNSNTLAYLLLSLFKTSLNTNNCNYIKIKSVAELTVFSAIINYGTDTNIPVHPYFICIQTYPNFVMIIIVKPFIESNLFGYFNVQSQD